MAGTIYKLRWLALVLCVSLYCVHAACGYEMNSHKGSKYKIIEGKKMTTDTDFLKVQLNENNFSICSPEEPAPDWRGVVINIPGNAFYDIDEQYKEQVISLSVIPLCGFNMFDALNVDESKPMTIIAISKDNGEKLSGVVVEIDPSPLEPPPEDIEPFDVEELEGIASGGYFNLNVMSFVEIPKKEATYLMHVEENGYKSNVVELQVKKYVKE